MSTLHGAWIWYELMTTDAPATKAGAEAMGGQVIHGPMQVPTGDWIINGIDPQGASFALVGSRHS